MAKAKKNKNEEQLVESEINESELVNDENYDNDEDLEIEEDSNQKATKKERAMDYRKRPIDIRVRTSNINEVRLLNEFKKQCELQKKNHSAVIKDIVISHLLNEDNIRTHRNFGNTIFQAFNKSIFARTQGINKAITRSILPIRYEIEIINKKLDLIINAITGHWNGYKGADLDNIPHDAFNEIPFFDIERKRYNQRLKEQVEKIDAKENALYKSEALYQDEMFNDVDRIKKAMNFKVIKDGSNEE